VCELHRTLHKPVALVPVVISRTGVVADEVAADFASLPMELAVGSLQDIAAGSSSGSMAHLCLASLTHFHS